MDLEKRIYYVDLVNGSVVETQDESQTNLRIEANEEDIAEFNQYFGENYTADLKAYARSHVPYLEYHHDKGNDEYDMTMKKIYALIYRLGDVETKRHIEKIGVLTEDKYTGDDEIDHFK